MNNKLKNIRQKMKIPIVMAPMFLISNPNMVINACKSGIIGSFPALNARTSEELKIWMQQIKRELMKAKSKDSQVISYWAVNFIAHKSNKRYKEDLEIIKECQPPIVITSLGDPAPVIQVVQQYGGVVLTDVINIEFAKKSVEKGTDGLILVSAGAGGHGGTYNPFPFINEVKTFWDGPIILAGGISNANDIVASEILGADFVYMGTRFIPTYDSNAQKEYKEMVLKSNMDQIIYTDVFSGIHANYLIPSIAKAGVDLKHISHSKNTYKKNVGNPEVRAWKDIWGAGQGVGSIKETQTVMEVIKELTSSYNLIKKNFIRGSRN